MMFLRKKQPTGMLPCGHHAAMRGSNGICAMCGLQMLVADRYTAIRERDRFAAQLHAAQRDRDAMQSECNAARRKAAEMETELARLREDRKTLDAINASLMDAAKLALPYVMHPPRCTLDLQCTCTAEKAREYLKSTIKTAAAAAAKGCGE